MQISEQSSKTNARKFSLPPPSLTAHTHTGTELLAKLAHAQAMGRSRRTHTLSSIPYLHVPLIAGVGASSHVDTWLSAVWFPHDNSSHPDVTFALEPEEKSRYLRGTMPKWGLLAPVK